MLVGYTEAIVTGFLAGQKFLILPAGLASGDIISYMHQEMKTVEGLKKKYTFSGSVYFQRMRERGLYSTDVKVIHSRVARLGLRNVFGQKIIRRW